MNTFLRALCGAAVALLAVASWAADAPAQLRIGYQKASLSLVLAKEHGLLEKRFPQTQIQWIEFPAGPQMLEALNIGSLDLASTGDIPPIFAQAAGADLLYVGVEPPKPQAETVLVPSASTIHSIADLKGKRVAFQKGSSSHNLLLRLLQREGMSLADIQPLYLTPADARAAFAAGQIDAWAIWDPWYSALTLDGQARLLANGEGLGLSGPFYLSTRGFAKQWPQVIDQALAVFNQAEALTRSDEAGSVAIMARITGLSQAVIAETFRHRPPSPITPVDAPALAAQQRTADLFRSVGILPRTVNVADATWQRSAP
ncbi:MAG: putative aliphatic sulfonates-binding protein [Pseudomonas citronellolis]|nr:MAG: putative aliphatic sulfonates-binding protein [Pseudomonas citronellolis]